MKGRFYSMVKMISRDYTTGYSVFAVDTVAELDKLPTTTDKGKDHLHTIPSCSVGSRAIVTETSGRYILNGEQNKWIKITSSSGGSGGGSESWATEEDIDKMFE